MWWGGWVGGWGWGLNDVKFGTCIGRVSSDGAPSRAVKGLKSSFMSRDFFLNTKYSGAKNLPVVANGGLPERKTTTKQKNKKQKKSTHKRV